VVLDVNPIVTENCKTRIMLGYDGPLIFLLDNITYYKCDVSKWDEVEAVSKRIVDELGHPTILVNNAGVVQGKSLVDLSVADIEQYVP
jgi:NAD(P)-dependent dehydrogenase (short-subunit alcohol dehydrogenase family)